MVFLNHGSFGACPKNVLQAQQSHRNSVEARPVRFYCHGIFEGLDRSRRAIASLVGGKPEDFVFLNNATTAVATVLDNIARGVGLAEAKPLGPGDEILVNTLEYPACLNNIERLAERTGATIIRAEIPWVMQDAEHTPGSIYEQIIARISNRTRLCLLSLIASPTGMVMPARRLIAELRRRGVATLLDAAHGPGAIDLDLDTLGAEFTTSNCHKWLCTPKGAAFLHVRPEHQPRFRPLCLSNHANAPEGAKGRSRFNLEFDYMGTDDVTARLTIADAIDLVPKAANRDWPGIITHNRDLALAARDCVLERLGTTKPASDEMVGPLACVPLPEVEPERLARLAARPTRYNDALQDALLERHSIQIPVWTSGRTRCLRLSAQVYNTIEQYRYLAEAVAEELDRESKL